MNEYEIFEQELEFALATLFKYTDDDDYQRFADILSEKVVEIFGSNDEFIDTIIESFKRWKLWS